MKQRLLIAALAAAGGFLGASAHGQIIDQQQPRIDRDAGFLGLGTDVHQKLAQTFRVGRTGELIALDLPIGCAGKAAIEIVEQVDGKPEGRVIGRGEFSGDTLDTPGFRTVSLSAPVSVTVGDEIGFSLERIDGECNYATAPVGDTYARGQGFFDARPNPPGWVSFKEFPGTPQDLAFKTIMAGAPSRPDACIAVGITDETTGKWLELPISRDTPICRCFEDPTLREMRCGVLHPDFFIHEIRPWPLTPGKPYDVKFEFTPLSQLDGPVKMHLEGGGISKPRSVVFGYKSKPGLSETAVVRHVAPEKPGGLQGAAFFSYDMKSAPIPDLTKFGLDRSLGERDFPPAKGKK